MQEIIINNQNIHKFLNINYLSSLNCNILFNFKDFNNYCCIEGLDDDVIKKDIPTIKCKYKAGSIILQQNDLIFLYSTRYCETHYIRLWLQKLVDNFNQISKHCFTIINNDIIVDSKYKIGSFVSWKVNNSYLNGIFFSSKSNEDGILKYTTKERKKLSIGFSELDKPISDFYDIIYKMFFIKEEKGIIYE